MKKLFELVWYLLKLVAAPSLLAGLVVCLICYGWGVPEPWLTLLPVIAALAVAVVSIVGYLSIVAVHFGEAHREGRWYVRSWERRLLSGGEDGIPWEANACTLAARLWTGVIWYPFTRPVLCGLVLALGYLVVATVAVPFLFFEIVASNELDALIPFSTFMMVLFVAVGSALAVWLIERLESSKLVGTVLFVVLIGLPFLWNSFWMFLLEPISVIAPIVFIVAAGALGFLGWLVCKMIRGFSERASERFKRGAKRVALTLAGLMVLFLIGWLAVIFWEAILYISGGILVLVILVASCVLLLPKVARRLGEVREMAKARQQEVQSGLVEAKPRPNFWKQFFAGLGRGICYPFRATVHWQGWEGLELWAENKLCPSVRLF